MSTDTLDIAQLKDRVNLVDVIGKYLAIKRSGTEIHARCCFANCEGSIKINERKQLFKCFSCGTGGDALDFLVKKGLTMDRALEELRSFAGEVPIERPKDQWKQILPPDDHPHFDIRHFKYGAPSRVWRYRTAESRLIGFVCRFDLGEGKKETWPYTYCTDGQVKKWKWHGFDTPRPLYNLHELHRRPDAIVLIIEGEKTADKAAELYPEFVCTTWIGGAQSVSHADWRPLARRKTITWSDNDDPGRAAMEEVRRILWTNHMGPQRDVRVPQDFPQHWDVADSNWTRQEAQQFLKSNIYQCRK